MSRQRKALAAALLASTPILVHGAAGNYAYFTDRDSGGGALYGGAPVWVKNAAACQAACSADPNCYGWTFSIPSNPTWDGPCYLKGTNNCDATSLTKVQTAGKYASGVIGDGCTVTCQGKTVTVGSSNCAVVTPTPTSTKAASRYRRDMAQREANMLQMSLCPAPLKACPIRDGAGGYECLDLSEELESCGACGNDCTRIPGVGGVTCSQGQCVVSSCAAGFSVGVSGQCIQTPMLAHRREARSHGRRLSGI